MEAHEIGTFKVAIQLKLLTLRRFRGFSEQLEVSFDENFTIIIGNNGAGKSAILDATAGLLDDFARLIQGEDYSPEDFFNYFDVNNEQGEDGNAEISLDFDVDFTRIKEIFYNDTNELIGEDWENVKNYNYTVGIDLRRGKQLTIKDFPVRHNEDKRGENWIRSALKKDLTDWMSKTTNPSFALHTSIELPVLAYFPVSRMEEETNNGEDQILETDIFTNYRNQELAPNSFSFKVLKKWLALQYLMKTQERKRHIEKERDRKLYDTIIGAIKQFVNEENGEAFSDIYFEWTPDYPEGEMVFEKNGIGLYFRQLSAGEKVVISLVADLARQLALSNPQKNNPLEGTGVVLIDEIDLHLHPGWQRRIVAKLREVFPNVQFVATTHSPRILSEIASKSIRMLHNNQILSADETYGREVDYIMEVIMDVSAGKFSSEVDRISQIIAKGTPERLEEAEKAIKELEQKINIEGERGDEHPDILRLSTLINRKKLLSR